MTLINYLVADLGSALITFLKGFAVYFCFASFAGAVVFYLIGIFTFPAEVRAAKMSAKRFILFQAVMLTTAIIGSCVGYQLIIRFFH